jgi:hypothetical protein
MINRENIYNELLSQLSTVYNFNTVSRRLKHWQDVPVAQMPALFLAQQHETVTQNTRQPAIITLHPEIYIYVSNGTSQTINPYSILNPIVDSITNLFTASNFPNGNNNLKGLVHTCKLSGTIDTDGGILGNVAVAIIPLEIIVPQT